MTTYTCYACASDFEAPIPATKEDETKLFDATNKGKVFVICEDCLEWNLVVNSWKRAAHMRDRPKN